MNVFLIKDINHPTLKPITLEASQKIGSGGMGSVWRIGNVFSQEGDTSNLVAKIYHNPDDPKTPSEEKLRAMIARTPDHVQEVINGVAYTQFAWVLYLIKDDHQRCIGFAMPELDFNQSISLNPFIYPREASRLTDYQNSLNYRVQLGANISALMADLHRHDHAFIDFKEQNLRLMPEALDGQDDEYKGFIVGFIDCDSFLITDNDGRKYPCTVLSPEMTSPEYHQHKDIAKLDEKHDRFVLAIELFKILNYGIHPFYFIPLSERLRNLSSRVTDSFIKERLYAYGVTPHPEIAPLKNSIHECWDDGTRAMFDRAFLSQNPADRPTAQDWENHLRALSQNRQFMVCERFADEVSHIHFVGKACHRCWLEGTLTPPTASYQQSPYGAGITNDVGEETNAPFQNEPQIVSQSVWQRAEHGNNQDIAMQNFTQPITSPPPITPTMFGRDEITRQHAILADNTASKPRETMIPNAVPQVPEDTTTQRVPPKTVSPPFNETVTQTITRRPVSITSKKSKKWWLVPLAVLGLGAGGYALSHKDSLMNTPNQATATNKSNKKATTTGDKANDTADNTNSYARIFQALPQAVSGIKQAQQSFTNKTVVGHSISSRSAAKLYQDTLGIEPDFFNAVVSVAKSGEADLQRMQTLGNQQDVSQIQAFTLNAFRNADLSYFNPLSSNKSLAKQLNEAAKTQYWTKNNPQAALYLQAQAVKNAPTQAEYTANLAFYLSKNNYPYTRDFMLYALQTPRDSNKYANTFMIELAAGLDAQAGDIESATGALLAQFYTIDDKAKRCNAMLKYPKTYPQLVIPAEQAFTVIEQQAEAGNLDVPAECLSPHAWVN